MKPARLTAALEAVTVLALIGLPVFALWRVASLWPVSANLQVLFAGHPAHGAPPTMAVAVALFVALIGLGLIMAALYDLRGLLRLYRRGAALSHAAARRIGRIGAWLLMLAVHGLLAYPILSVLLTMGAPVGERQLVVSVSQAQIGFLLAGGIMTLIGWAMRDAAALAEENRGFV